MISLSKKCYSRYIFRISSVFCAIILLIIISNIKVSADDMEWDVTINFNEASGKNDYIVFGEVSNASDGLDSYDIPNPPGGVSPALDAYIPTDFSYPHNRLLQEIKEHPDTDKEWNFTVKWIDGDTTVTVTMSWDTDEIISSEYESVFLYDGGGTFLADMSINNNYEFLCSSYIPVDFKIICSSASHAPDTPNNPNPGGGFTGVAIDTDLSWSGGDPDPEDTVTYDVYFGTNSNPPMVAANHNSTTYNLGELNNATCYYWKIIARDNHGHTTEGPVWNFTTVNRPPYIPDNPSPTGNSISVNTALSWTGGDPDDSDIVTYDIYFGSSNPPPLVISEQSSTFFYPGTLSYETTYYWQIVAWDNHGVKTNGPLWSFATEPSSNGNSGDNGGSNDGPTDKENQPPTADASASETFGFIGALIIFDGSLSADLDGYITNWSWDFGDDDTGSGEITTHVYTDEGTYAVTLTICDNDDATDTNTIIIVISKGNNAPTKPLVNGTKTGSKNTEYTYTVVSTDSDNDTISYIFEWGDETITTSEFLPNGTNYAVQNKWTTAGIYAINITATDNKTTSEQTTLIILIDACFVGTTGYLIDSDGDGTYDLFHANATGIETLVKKQENEHYLIDVDGNGNWDYTYDQVSGATTLFKEEVIEGGPWIIFALISIALTVVAVIVYFHKKNYL